MEKDSLGNYDPSVLRAPPNLRLEDVFSGDFRSVRISAADALFSPDPSERAKHINYLRRMFPNLIEGRVENGNVVLTFRLENCVRPVNFLPIPRNYMDRPYYCFEFIY